MSIADGLNIVDNALNMAVEDLKNRGISEDEAQIALLIRLWNIVPQEVAEIAELLRKDPELASAINKDASPSGSVDGAA
ncbi:hypothetical protein N9I56_04525 [Alphaproteobacteria bacterium]|jgi:hypothetical protein|nr:hypothetical protein [Alphaproteobacteria bacterium]MDA9022725.1 hypothetical protein [Alphaproteobacteria bacterium]